jgi:hypothetical protein
MSEPKQAEYGSLLSHRGDPLPESFVELFKGYDWIKANKNHWLIENEEHTRFNKRLMGSCIGPCFKGTLTTPVISNEESNCFTNCMGKGLESQYVFSNLNMDTHIERYGGFKN